MERGKFVSFEGTDGTGKSTQIAAFVDLLKTEGVAVELVREPGSTKIGERVREMLLSPEHSEMAPVTELLLYEAARAQLVKERILPALEKGTWVVSDRYADSTWAYQHAGRGLERVQVEAANELGTDNMWPDATVVLALDPDEAFKRAHKDHAPDRLEQAGLAFQKRVYAGYLELQKIDPARVVVIDAVGAKEEVTERIWRALATRLALPHKGHAKKGA